MFVKGEFNMPGNLRAIRENRVSLEVLSQYFVETNEKSTILVEFVSPKSDWLSQLHSPCVPKLSSMIKTEA